MHPYESTSTQPSEILAASDHPATDDSPAVVAAPSNPELAVLNSSESGTIHPAPATPTSSLVFHRLPGETIRAYTAFTAYFQLGAERSHQAVADRLDELLGTVKKWASKFNWTDRIHAFNAALLEQHVSDEAASRRAQFARWKGRVENLRELEWSTAEKMLAIAQCYLEVVEEKELSQITLGQAARALKISSEIGRHSIAGFELPKIAEPELSPIQKQLLDGVHRIYGQSPDNHKLPPSLPSQPSESLVKN